MNLSVVVAALEGCPFAALNDPGLMEKALSEAVAAGRFTELHRHVHLFEPQGITAAVVLSESHIAIHTWPEHGVMFIDIASCSGELAARAAFERICELVPHTTIKRDDFAFATRARAVAARAG